MVRLSGESEPVPLRSLGDGVVRMFEIALALEFAGTHVEEEENGAQGKGRKPHGFLLLDEVENGVHHTLHKTVWEFIFHMAKLHDIQVFATTHSLDCLRGFGEAVSEDGTRDGLVVRLEKVEGEERTGAVVIDQEDLPIVIRDSIEVR